jgi:hypothetical protein
LLIFFGPWRLVPILGIRLKCDLFAVRDGRRRIHWRAPGESMRLPILEGSCSEYSSQKLIWRCLGSLVETQPVLLKNVGCPST